MGIKILSLSKNEDFKKILTGKKINNSVEFTVFDLGIIWFYHS